MLLVGQLTRRRKLREDYALLWFLGSIVLLVFSIYKDLLNRLAALLGVAYPPSLLLLAAIILGFLLAMHFSIALSRLTEQNKRLAQEVAFLRLAISKDEGGVSESS